MADASSQLEFAFSNADNLSVDSFKASYERSDLFGNFAIRVTATKANNLNTSTFMSIKVGGVLLETKLSIVVNPNDLT
jgi:hypothetical protein